LRHYFIFLYKIIVRLSPEKFQRFFKIAADKFCLKFVKLSRDSETGNIMPIACEKFVGPYYRLARGFNKIKIKNPCGLTDSSLGVTLKSLKVPFLPSWEPFLGKHASEIVFFSPRRYKIKSKSANGNPVAAIRLSLQIPEEPGEIIMRTQLSGKKRGSVEVASQTPEFKADSLTIFSFVSDVAAALFPGAEIFRKTRDSIFYLCAEPNESIASLLNEVPLQHLRNSKVSRICFYPESGGKESRELSLLELWIINRLKQNPRSAITKELSLSPNGFANALISINEKRQEWGLPVLPS
jgi:hypothetical protein